MKKQAVRTDDAWGRTVRADTAKYKGPHVSREHQWYSEATGAV